MGLLRFVRGLREGLKFRSWAETPRTPPGDDDVPREAARRETVEIQAVPSPNRPLAQAPVAAPADANIVDVEPIDLVELPQPNFRAETQEAALENELIPDDLRGLDETFGDTPAQPIEPELDHEPEPEFALHQMQTDEGVANMAREFYARRTPRANQG